MTYVDFGFSCERGEGVCDSFTQLRSNATPFSFDLEQTIIIVMELNFVLILNVVLHTYKEQPISLKTNNNATNSIIKAT